MFDTIKEEDMLNYYLHKYALSDISYQDYKSAVEANMKAKDKTDEEILSDVKDIIDNFNKGVNREIHIEENKQIVVLE